MPRTLLIVLLFAVYLWPQDDIQFSHLTVEDGLSQSTISASYQDSRGFMWFGTQDGLNRYDGNAFRVFRHNRSDSNSISNNWIWNIDEDGHGDMWISTFGGGLCHFNRKTEKFTTFRNDPADSTSISHNTIWDVQEYPQGNYWVATNNGLNRMTVARDTVSHTTAATFEYIPHDSVLNNTFQILKAAGDEIWVTSFSGLYRYTISKNSYDFFTPDSSVTNFGRMRGHAGKSGYLWLNSGNGIYRFDPNTKKSRSYKHDPSNKNSIISNFTTAILEDQRGLVWVGTTSWLTVMDTLGHFAHYNYDPLDNHSLNHNFISSIYQDAAGIVWIGSRNGVNYYSPSGHKFKHIKANPYNPESLSNKNIIGLLEDSQNYIWIGTTDGLNRLDRKTAAFKVFKTNAASPQLGPSANYILSLMQSRDDEIWIGTRNGGLSVYNPTSQRFRHYRNDPADPASLSFDVVLCILEDSQGRIWLGTNGGGLNLYHPETNNFSVIPSNQDPTTSMNDVSVFGLYEDSYKRIWIATAAGGINLMDPENGTFRHFTYDEQDSTTVASNMVVCFYESQDGQFWVGTTGGMCKLISTKASQDSGIYKFRRYGFKDGLPNEVIYGILEDDNKNLWSSTNGGLARTDVSVGKFDVKTYKVDDGLLDNEFNQNSYLKTSDGWLYFGGSEGVNYFHPDSINDNAHIPPIAITHFSVLNKRVNPGGEQSILDHTISETKQLNLSWQDNVFSFEFASLDFTNPAKNRYAYKMEGFDEEWIYSGSRNFVSYMNLPAGDYTFRVRGSNNDGIWNEQGTSLAISISSPPWETWWAFSIYFLSIAALIYGFMRYKVREKDKELETFARIEQAKSEERARVRKEASADFHDEAGNLVTKITLFIELAKREVSQRSKIKPYLEKIEDNAKQISGSMRDFIWALDPGKDSLRDTYSRLEAFGNSMFEYSDIQFSVTGMRSLKSGMVMGIDDRRAILLIFKEAMNNCLKYSGATHARLSIQFKDSILSIKFSDNGIGFKPKEKGDGYGLQNMNNRARKINAQIKIDAISGKGVKVAFEKKINF